MVLMTALFLLFHGLKAQVIFSEDFENGMPSSFRLIDGDGRTPNPLVGYVTDAWVAYPDFADTGNTVAVSTSYYTPVGRADDWMITPLIHLDSFCVLQWKAEAFSANYPDGYQVRIAIAGRDTADFLANTPLFSIWNEHTVRTARRIDLAASGYASRDVYIAFRNNSNDMWTLIVDDIQVKNRPLLDAALIALQVPRSACHLTNAESIAVDIENFGRNAISVFDVSYVVDNGISRDTVTETVNATIQPGDTLRYTFVQKADLSSDVAYTVSAYLSDNDNSNNAVPAESVINIKSHEATTPYYTSFENFDERLGWRVEDRNNDGFTWFLSTVANTGSFAFRYNWNRDLPADDWLYSTCIDLTGGHLYKLTFSYRVGKSNDTIYDERMKIFAGENQTAAGMTMLLADYDSIVNDFYQEEEITFTALATGTHYIGFQVYSDKDKFFLALDDVTVAEVLPPVAGFVTGSSTNPLRINFSSTSTGADSLYWDFGDDSTSTANPAVSHTYAARGIYYVCLTAFNTVGSDTYCTWVAVDTLTAVKPPSEALVKIYPNPADARITVETGYAYDKAFAIICDVMGREIVRRQIHSEKTDFDLTHQPEGIYFITVKRRNSAFREKVLLLK